LSFTLQDVGFAPDTIVHARDLLAQADLGNVKGAVTTAEAVSPHGSAMLRLSFAPKYPQQSEEL
jgi:hypothetical protein